MWMSLAPFWMADIRMTFTSLMTGASSPWRAQRLDADFLDFFEDLDVIGAAELGMSSSALLAASSALGADRCRCRC